MTSLLTSLTRLPSAGQSQFVATFDGLIGTATGALIAGSVYKVRVRTLGVLTISTLSVAVVSTATGNIDVAIIDPTSGARLAGPSAPAAIGASGSLQSFALAAPFTLSPYRDYDFAVGSDAAPTLVRASGFVYANALGARAMRKSSAYSSGIPNPITGFSADAVAVWIAGA